MHFKNTILISFTLLLFGCSDKSEKTIPNNADKHSKSTPDKLDEKKSKKLFELKDAKSSGFYFLNELLMNEEYNVLTYENYFNGAGVGIGDFNNDNLPDIFMTGNFFGGRLYLNKGDMKFEQISEKANVFAQGFFTDVAIVDINGDGYDDIYLSRSLTNVDSLRRNILLVNNRNNTFTDRAKEYGIDDAGYTHQVVFFDMDNDQDLDLYVLNHRKDFKNALTIYDTGEKEGNVMKGDDMWNPLFSDKLYRNDNGHFTDITKNSGIENNDFSLSVVATDINNDGLSDLYISNDFVSRDHIYINQGNGHFKDELSQRIGHIAHSAMGTDIADINNDGLLDIYSLDMTPESNYRQKQLSEQRSYDSYKLAQQYGFQSQISRNMMHLNTGNGTYSEIGQLIGAAYTDWSWGGLITDFDNDGLEDIYITNGHHKDITDMDYKKYQSVNAIRSAGGLENVKMMSLIDLMSSTLIPNYLLKNEGNLQFANKTREWGLEKPSHSNGVAYADLDLDGDLDLIVNNFDHESFLYENKTNEELHHNFISIQLKGSKLNSHGFGSRIYLFQNGTYRLKEATPYRGFLSSVSTDIHFGLGLSSSVDSILVVWPGGKMQTVYKPEINQLLTLKFEDAKGSYNYKKPPSKPMIKELNPLAGYLHSESDYNDFKQQPLLEHFISDHGPVIAVADVNGDGNKDIYVGGSAGFSGKLFTANDKGEFKELNIPDFQLDAAAEDAGCAFFDANADSFPDLYVSSGSIEYEKGSPNYKDRFYLNDGKGHFIKQQNFPSTNNASSCVLPFDYDQDGDLDIFVGGYFIPNNYPMADKSKLLRNDQGIFTDVSDLLPEKGALGAVSDAKLLSKNQFVFVGEWNAIRILDFNGTRFQESSKIPNSNGWWNCIATGDFDNDGDTDIVAGNRGLNKVHRPYKDKPVKLYYGDFDGNGDPDALTAYYFPVDNAYFLKHSLDELFMQMKGVRKTFNSYSAFSKSSPQDIIPPNAKYLQAHTFQSVYIENNNQEFQLNPLPTPFQFSYLNDFLIEDLNGDGYLDLVAVGNKFNTDIKEGKADSNQGVVALGDGTGRFAVLSKQASGFDLFNMDSRQIRSLGNKQFVVSNNSGPLRIFQFSASLN